MLLQGSEPLDKPLHVPGERAFEARAGPRARVRELEPGRVQGGARESADEVAGRRAARGGFARPAVRAVADHRAPQVGQVDADLVSPAGVDATLTRPAPSSARFTT